MTEPVLREIDTVEELLTAAHLTLIQYYEVSGRRFDGFEDQAVWPDDKEDGDGIAQVRVMQRLDGDTLAVRSRAEVHTPEGQLIADVAAFFRAEEMLSVSAEVALAFANRVAAPIVRPYLREAISSTAVRLGMAAPLLAPLDHDGDEVVPHSLARAVTSDADRS